MATTGIAKVYASLIKKGKMTIDDVPEAIRDEVREILGIWFMWITNKEGIPKRVFLLFYAKKEFIRVEAIDLPISIPMTLRIAPMRRTTVVSVFRRIAGIYARNGLYQFAFVERHGIASCLGSAGGIGVHSAFFFWIYASGTNHFARINSYSFAGCDNASRNSLVVSGWLT